MDLKPYIAFIKFLQKYELEYNCKFFINAETNEVTAIAKFFINAETNEVTAIASDDIEISFGSFFNDSDLHHIMSYIRAHPPYEW